MGRGGRGGGGGSRGGGGHRSSRSGGGHRVSGGSRGGRGGGGYSGGSSHSPHSHHYHHTAYHHYGGGGNNTFTSVLVIIIFFVFVPIFLNIFSALMTSQRSMIQRYKLESGNGFINDCVIDELGWIDNENMLETQLKKFWDKTGVQPFIVMKDYDPTLLTDNDKDQYAFDYYDRHFEDREDVFLYIYYCEADPDDAGYMTYVNGMQVSSVMDSEAISIFWGILDKEWASDKDFDDMYADIYTQTANVIMKVSKTGKDILFVFLLIVFVLIAAGIAIYLMNKKRKHEAQRAAETERILNSNINDLAQQNPEDQLMNQYLNDNND